MNCDIDHLVIGTASLEQGLSWCEATLGIPPGPGGVHPFMGTHNRLLRIDGPGFANTYLEIIAINPAAPPPGRVRWFGLDDPVVQDRLALGPQLLTAVARTPNVEMLRWGLINFAQDRVSFHNLLVDGVNCLDNFINRIHSTIGISYAAFNTNTTQFHDLCTHAILGFLKQDLRPCLSEA